MSSGDARPNPADAPTAYVQPFGVLDGALWIAPYEPFDPGPGSRPAYWMRREFECADVASAMLAVTARGLVEVFVNSVRVNDEELLPGYTQYDHRIPYRSNRVESLLRPGRNVVAVLIADGWFRGKTGLPRASNQWGTQTSLALSIAGSAGAIVTSDAAWRSSTSHIVQADLIDGQQEDRRLVNAAVHHVGFDDTQWSDIEVVAAPTASLVAYDAPPVRRVSELPAISVDRRGPGSYVVDFGQNSNGWCRLTNLGPRDTVLTLQHGEWLDTQGDLTIAHLVPDIPILAGTMSAGQLDSVTSAGIEGDVFEPRFTTHGFRYVHISGYPDDHPFSVDDITSVVVHSDLDRTGRFECSDPLLNRLHEAAVWSLRSNMCDIPTDCPQRERSGWTGDWQLFVPTAAFLYNIETFSEKFLTDVRLDQRVDGAIANVTPSNRVEGFAGKIGHLNGSAGWGDVITAAPWAAYEAYGSTASMASNWDAMKRWVEFGLRCAELGRSDARRLVDVEPRPHHRYLWDTGFHWGEWLEPGMELGDFFAFSKADKSEVATAYLYRSLGLVSSIGDVLGHTDDAKHYADVAVAVRDAWRREFLRDGLPITQSQAAHVRALTFGLLDPDEHDAVAEGLVGLIREAGTTVGTGFLSTPYLLPALADNDRLDVAYELLLQTNMPSWLGMIERGATTVWERWEGVDDDGIPHESLNHYSKAAVVSFLHRYVAGLNATSPGYRTFAVVPRPGGGLTSASCSLETRHGQIAIDWTMRRGAFGLRLAVPGGTSATVTLPNGAAHDVGPGTHRFTT